MIDFVDALVFVLSRLQGLFVTVSIVSLMAALGTRLTQGGVVGTIRQYNLISRWALANLLAVPIFALLLGVVFDLSDPFVLGLLLVAIAPGAPFIPQLVAMAGEDSQEAVHLTVALTLVATVTVPLIVATLLALFGVDIRFSPWRFLWPLVALLVIPMVAGSVLRYYRPDLAVPLARGLLVVANVTLGIALVLVVLLNLRTTIRAFTAMLGTGALAVMTVFVLASVLVGWVVGGPAPRDRRILALGTAGRNINVALFIATGAFPESGVAQSIAALAVVMLIVSLLVARYWRRHPLSEEVESTDNVPA